MYYYGARYYDPRISIFVSVDPLAEQTFEPYLYTGNNPIMFTDPTGMSKDGIEHDYRLSRKGTLTKIWGSANSADYDRIINDKGESVNVPKSFINFSYQSPDGRGTIYPLGNEDLKNNNGDKIFDFLRINTDIEYGLNEFMDTNTGVNSGYISTSFDSGTVRGSSSEFYSRMRSNDNLIATKDVHSHPRGGAFSESARPSGFQQNLEPYSRELFGDRRVYRNFNRDFPGRIPNFFEVRLNQDKENQVKIFYNYEKVIRTHCGIPY